MPLIITGPDEPLRIEPPILTLYGQPGLGKTSLAFTTRKPLLLDFDGGAQRSGFRKHVVAIQSWEDVAAITKEDLAEYDTVIIDTVGSMYDKIMIKVCESPKMVTKNGAPQIQAYGEANIIFGGFIRMVRAAGKQLVLIAHAKEEQIGEDKQLRPSITGSSKDYIIQRSDVVGYLHVNDGVRVLELAPAAFGSWFAKNPANIDRVEFGRSDKSGTPWGGFLEKNPLAFQELIDTMMGRMRENAGASREAISQVAAFGETLELASDPTDFDRLLETANNAAKAVGLQMKSLMREKLKKMATIQFNQQTKVFELVTKPEPETPSDSTAASVGASDVGQAEKNEAATATTDKLVDNGG